MNIEPAGIEATRSPHVTSRPKSTKQRMYSAEAISGDEAVQTFLENVDGLEAQTVFQAPLWMRETYRHLSQPSGAIPYLVVVRRRVDGDVVLVLPLALAKQVGETIVGFPDFGVADYGSLMTGPGWTADALDIDQLCSAILSALPKVDRLSLTSVPVASGDLGQVLKDLGHNLASRHSGYVVTIVETVEAFLRHRGKKYRKEVERCGRLLEASGRWTLKRAESKAEIEQAFAVLHQMQSHRWSGQLGSYKLNDDPVAQFYLSTLLAQAEDVTPQIFTLTVDEVPIAVLYGVLSGQMFTMLRIASDNDQWSRVSPGRMIVLTVMRHFVAQNVRTFDLGIGDYAFKRGLGAEPVALIDIERAFTWRGHWSVMLMQGKAWLRRHPRLLAAAKRLKDRLQR
jgi:CelD/BcsL family acetyltransferase involved in cellulose biosynthesis